MKQTEKYDQCIAEDDIDILRQLAAFLKPFEQLTELVSAFGPSISFILLMKHKIKKMRSTLDHEDDNIKRLKRLVLQNVNKRLEELEACKVALIFDPITDNLTEKETAKKTIRSIVTKLKSKGILNLDQKHKRGAVKRIAANILKNLKNLPHAVKIKWRARNKSYVKKLRNSIKKSSRK